MFRFRARNRKMVADGEPGWQRYVPAELRPFFNQGKRLIDPQEYGDIFTTEIDFDAFRSYLAQYTYLAGGESSATL